MIRAKNEKDLMNILRLISSEAVSLSKKMNENKDPSLKKFMSQYKKDESLYGSLSEQEGEEPEEEEMSDDPPAEEPPSEEPPSEEPPEEPEAQQPDDEGEVGASFDSVVQAVNNLRAGKSLRDSSIKQQAQDYYDKLSDDERTTLLVFLKAMSDIIAGQVDGIDAQDPSDPPVSIKIGGEPEDSQEDMSEPEEEPAAPDAETQEDELPADEAGEEPSEEDTTPPIKVNESQDIDMLRKKVRRMMLRG